MANKYLHKIYGGWGCDGTCFICGQHMEDFGPGDGYSIGGGRKFDQGFIDGQDGFLHCIELIPKERIDTLREHYQEGNFIICGLANKYPELKKKLEAVD